MIQAVSYKHLQPKPGSNYKQLFCGRIRAEVLYRETLGVDALTPEQVAQEYDVPLEAVVEAIDYCTSHKDILDAERTRERQRIAAAGRDKWPYAPKDFQPEE
jgi:uncharacterized protein (DUF433 family)